MRDLDPKLVDEALDLDRLDLPKRPRVRRLLWDPYVNWLGEPSLRVWVVLDDRTPQSERAWKRLSGIDHAVRRALGAIREERFPYIHYLTETELRRQRRAG